MECDTDNSFLAWISLACLAKIWEISHPRYESIPDSTYGGSNTYVQISWPGLQYYEVIWGRIKDFLYPPLKRFNSLRNLSKSL